MYNKLFAKIVDSSIWLEPDQTRIVWFMFIALMNEDGFVQFASIANVAYRARISHRKASEALNILEGPDPNSADSDNDGRRVEKVPGGWMVLNAHKYRDLVTREMIREQTRARVARHRAKSKSETQCNADVTPGNALKRNVTISDTDTEKKKKAANKSPLPSAEDWLIKLEQNPAYKDLNVRDIHAKMSVWCQIRGIQPTLRRLVNWLNRQDKPINGSEHLSPQHRQNRINFLNEKKQQVNRQIKDPINPPSWAEKELQKIDAELKTL